MTDSMLEDMAAIKRLSNQILSLCSKCGEKLEHEPSQPRCHDEPGHKGGWWCPNCERWDDE